MARVFNSSRMHGVIGMIGSLVDGKTLEQAEATLTLFHNLSQLVAGKTLGLRQQ